jgi:hypothetical protein
VFQLRVNRAPALRVIETGLTSGDGELFAFEHNGSPTGSDEAVGDAAPIVTQAG